MKELSEHKPRDVVIIGRINELIPPTLTKRRILSSGATTAS
jgi:hypothetical protein